jgi:hypothetical protein
MKTPGHFSAKINRLNLPLFHRLRSASHLTPWVVVELPPAESDARGTGAADGIAPQIGGSWCDNPAAGVNPPTGSSG